MPHRMPSASTACGNPDCAQSSAFTHVVWLLQEERDASLDAFKEKFGSAGDVRRDDLTIMASKVVGVGLLSWCCRA